MFELRNRLLRATNVRQIAGQEQAVRKRNNTVNLGAPERRIDVGIGPSLLVHHTRNHAQPKLIVQGNEIRHSIGIAVHADGVARPLESEGDIDARVTARRKLGIPYPVRPRSFEREIPFRGLRDLRYVSQTGRQLDTLRERNHQPNFTGRKCVGGRRQSCPFVGEIEIGIRQLLIGGASRPVEAGADVHTQTVREDGVVLGKNSESSYRDIRKRILLPVVHARHFGGRSPETLEDLCAQNDSSELGIHFEPDGPCIGHGAHGIPARACNRRGSVLVRHPMSDLSVVGMSGEAGEPTR